MRGNSLAKLALIATLFASVVVMLGAWTRLVDAGLGCPDWPGCYGFISVPNTPEKIELAEARFPHAPVEVEKGWPEMIHRYFASSLGLIIIGIAVLAYRKGRREGFENVPLKHSLGLLALVICQGLFGMWTVTLKLWPQVVSAHLLGGFATLSLLFLLVLRSMYTSVLPTKLTPLQLGSLKKIAAAGLVLVVLQIFLGAWTASNYAALACGTELPGCHNSLWPPMDFAEGFNFTQTIGPNYLGGLIENDARVAIHYTHRLGAVVLSLFLCWALWRMRIASDNAAVSIAAKTVFVVLCIQLGLGLSNVIWLVPLPIAIAHNAVGALLLMSLVNLNYQLSRLRLLNSNE